MNTPSLDDRVAEFVRMANEEAWLQAVRRCIKDDVALDLAVKIFEQAAKHEKLASMRLSQLLPNYITTARPRIGAVPSVAVVKRKPKKGPTPVKRSGEEKARIKVTIIERLLDNRGYVPIKKILDEVRRRHPGVKDFLIKQLIGELVKEERISRNTSKRHGEYMAKPQGASASLSPHMYIRPAG